MSGFKVGDKVRCINAEPFRSGDPSGVELGKEYEIEVCGESTCGLVGKLLHYRCDRFEPVTPSPPVYEHEGRRYQETHSGVAGYEAAVAVIGARVEAGDLVIIATPIPLTRDEIIERATRVLRDRLGDAFPWGSFGVASIDAAVRSVVDDVMGEQP